MSGNTERPQEHTEACEASLTALAEYTERWPDFCHECGARGYWEWGGSWQDPPDGGLCASCLEDGRCPRCAAAIECVPEARCVMCGWDSVTAEAAARAGQEPPDGLIAPEYVCECGWPDEAGDALDSHPMLED